MALESNPVTGRIYELRTPEGVPLRLTLAEVGDRAIALMIDLLLIFVAIGVLILLLVFAFSMTSTDPGDGFLGAAALLAAFVLRNFYFAGFELRWQGATPGKRFTGLRVIDAAGGSLTAEAVFARNLMREVEIFLPVAVLLSPHEIWPEAPGWALVLSSLWVFGFLFLPLLNRQRLRLGDLVAGTIVVRTPQILLLEDLGRIAPSRALKQSAPQPEADFTAEQLDLYGVYELQVLEDLLRAELQDNEKLTAVSKAIQKKIGWKDSSQRLSPHRFLELFYRAQRARLEQKMLFGKRQERKKSGVLERR